MNIEQILKAVREDNPYPADVFTEPTKEDKERMRNALKRAGLSPDSLFGSEARRVWGLCLDEIEKRLREAEVSRVSSHNL